MAVNEGTGPTELLTGWSSVVHQPCEEPEESELPSTVDMAAFTSGLNVEPTAAAQNDNSDSESDSEADSSNSGTEASQSSSQSESCDTDSSSSSSSSSSPSPEFSITSSQTNVLRLKIHAVKKQCSSPSVAPVEKTTTQRTTKNDETSSSESPCSSDSDSESETDNSSNKVSAKTTSNDVKRNKHPPAKTPEKKTEEKKIPKKDGSPKVHLQKLKIKKESKKMASLPVSRGSTYATSDSDDSDTDSAMLASCSLQEIRQEDLAAILPDQQECDAFGGFDSSRADKSSPQVGDMSGSDMELPQQAVNALIQRTTESSSDSESHPPPNPNSLYANSLLQQFVAQTQMLSAPQCPTTSSNDQQKESVNSTENGDVESNVSTSNAVKRRRGRPRKVQTKNRNEKPEAKTQSKCTSNSDYNANPNVSPDSGIQNSPDHVSSPEPTHSVDKLKPSEEKKAVNSNEKKKKNVSDVKTESTNVSSAATNNKSKPVSKLAVTSNRFDRLLYGNADRILYPPRRKAGRPPVVRKGPGRPPKHKTITQQITDKHVEKAPPKNATEKTSTIQVKTKPCRSRKNSRSNKNTNVNNVKEVVHKKTKSTLLYEICERVSKRLEMNNKYTQKTPLKEIKIDRQKPLKTKHRNRPVLLTKNKMDMVKTKYTTLKNAKLMHSKHKHKKHKKCKFKILKPIASPLVDPKINLEIEKLIADFMKLCIISTQKPPKENVPELFKTLKKVTKKRKTTEYNERKKKKQNVTAAISKDTNSNEQRLPLKKRHYHLSANNDNKVEPNVESTQSNVEDAKADKNKNTMKITVPISKSDKPKPTHVPQKIETVKTAQSSPKHIPVIKMSGNACPKLPPLNNNDYDSNSKVKSHHIDEAIEACINKFSDTKLPKPEVKPVEIEKEPKVNIPLTATTPKKRHRLEMVNASKEVTSPVKEEIMPVLTEMKSEDTKVKIKTPVENVVTEMKTKRNLSPRNSIDTTQKKTERKPENIVQMNTRKKNRIEDLASNLVSKITPPNQPPMIEKKKKEVKEEVRVSVIKYPVCKKAKPTENEKLDTITSAKPTGIFMPTVDLEVDDSILQAATKEKTDHTEKQENKKPEEVKKNLTEPVPVNQVIKSPEVKKKLRKRRAINRTGFPTVKKKKKKLFPEPIAENKTEVEGNNVAVLPEGNKACDRVPKDGEEYTKFVERTEKSDFLYSKAEEASRWEVMSECDSLPQEERTEIELDDLKPEVKLERMVLRARDSSPATSIDTKLSDRREEDLDDLTLEARMEQLRVKLEKKRKREREKLEFHSYPKRRLRDISPASSIEPHLDRKFSRDEGSSASSDENKRNKKAPRWRKKYLLAGLFSDYYKEDDETARLRRSESVSVKSRFTYDPADHPYGLLPPPYHCGKYLRCRKLPFQLPYDLWWQHTHSQLPGRDLVPSWNYRKIRTNVYNVKSSVGACEPQSCNCTPSENCGDDCINRLVLAECPASHRCHNQKIQRHEWAPGIEKFMTESKGWGVRTKLPIKNGEFILEYVGEVVSDQEFKERMATIYVNDTHHYCLHLDGGLVIDGHRMGGDGRFVNHSCKPNCEMQKWSVNGQFRMALFALRDIGAGEELTYDYNFSLFNPAEGQECLCGSENCRGVIGGKSQRVRQLPESTTKPPPGRVGRPRKNQAAKKTTNNVKEPPVKVIPAPQPVLPAPSVKPISHQQKCFILEHHCFLLRNLTKVRKVRSIASIQVSRHQANTPSDQGVAFMNHLNALQKPRNIKTRRLAQAEENPELNKSVKLAAVLNDVWNTVAAAKDENKKLLSTAFMTLPSKRKVPEFYQRITEPIDLTTVEQNIATGVYRTLNSFNTDMNRVFTTNMKFYGYTSDIGIAAKRLKKIYTEAKQQYSHKFEDVLGKKPPANFMSSRVKNEEEDVIRCICGMYKDEGLMIQCERCLCWQHSECVKADISASYHCERCVPRKVDYEIPLDEFTEHGHRYYMTLLRGDLQLRQGDTVYVLRDIPIPGTDRKHTYDTISKISFPDLDIFRIERLWKDSKTGQRFAYGHHYLRPHETYHEPTRKFFPNEVMRVPLYEAVPVELVICHCWVMDLNTYCKGRPIDAPEEHIYICEYRVDKSARLFSKVSKSKFPLCTKSYAFERFDTRLKISRTYTPHDVDPTILKARGRKPQENEVEKEPPVRAPMPVPVPVVRTLTEQKTRLNKILLNLLNKMPTKQTLDVSYLLEGGRRRKKQNDGVKN